MFVVRAISCTSQHDQCHTHTRQHYLPSCSSTVLDEGYIVLNIENWWWSGFPWTELKEWWCVVPFVKVDNVDSSFSHVYLHINTQTHIQILSSTISLLYFFQLFLFGTIPRGKDTGANKDCRHQIIPSSNRTKIQYTR